MPYRRVLLKKHCIHSFIRLFTRSFIHSFIHSSETADRCSRFRHVLLRCRTLVRWNLLI